MRHLAIALFISSIGMIGCGTHPSSDSTLSSNFDPSLIADVAPTSTISVGKAHKEAQHDQVIQLEGRIGGPSAPFIKGLAAFTMVDFSIPECCGDECSNSDCGPDEIAKNLATVKFIDPSGKPIPTDARELLNVREKLNVVVEGVAQRDPHGNLTVLAQKIFIRSE